jgi:glutathione S-transferase
MALALYHNDMSICSQKVRLVLAEKGRDWENRHLNLRAGEHQQEWYMKLNPRAVVPTLIGGDIVVPESNVINEYLDERFPEPPLKPSDPFDRAHAAVDQATRRVVSGRTRVRAGRFLAHPLPSAAASAKPAAVFQNLFRCLRARQRNGRAPSLILAFEDKATADRCAKMMRAIVAEAKMISGT